MLTFMMVGATLGSIYHIVTMIFFNIAIFNEAVEMLRDEKKDRYQSRGIEWLLFFIYLFGLIPKYVLTLNVMEESNFTL